jgi:hypothetical protein
MCACVCVCTQIHIFDTRNQSLIRENQSLEAAFTDALEHAQREEAASASWQAQVICRMRPPTLMT